VVAYEQLGYLLFTLGRTPEARKAYEKSRDLAAAMIRADPGASQPQLDLASAHDNIGDLLRFNNDIPGAEANFLKAIGVREQLVQGHRQDPEVLRALCVSIAKIGLIHLRRGEYPEALVQFKRSLTILDEFAPSYPSRFKVLGDYEYINRQLSEACMMSDWDAAVSYAQKSLESAQAVVALEPDNVVSRTKLAIVHERLGTATGLRGDIASAEANYRKAMELRQALSNAEPEAAELQRNVATSHQSCGALLLHRHDIDAVRAHYEKGLAMFETLAAADPGSVQKQSDVLETYAALADIAERAERFAEALEWAERAARRLDQIEREKHMHQAFLEEGRGLVKLELAVYKAAANSLKLEDASAAPSPDFAPAFHDYWRLLRGFALARRGRHAGAAVLAKDIRERNPKDAIILLRCSRIYALCATAVTSGKPEPALEPEQRKLEQNYIDSTLDTLRQALRLSPDKALDAFAETDFDFLRQRGILQSFVQDLSRRAKPRGSSK
jgi:tetratricopeptide (TPR) repeat protein